MKIVVIGGTGLIGTKLVKSLNALGHDATVEITGSEKIQLSELVRKYLVLKQDRLEVIADVHAPYFGVEINDSSLTPKYEAFLGNCVTMNG